MPRIGTENQRPDVTAFVCGIERLMATVDSFSCNGGLWPFDKNPQFPCLRRPGEGVGPGHHGKSERKNPPLGRRDSAFLVLWCRLRCFGRGRPVAVAVGAFVGAAIAYTGPRVTSGVGLVDRV